MKLSDQEQVVLKAIDRVGRNGLASIAAVIKAVGYPKATTKKVLLRLSEKGVVSLHRHDWPASLKPEQRKMMVRIGNDYFNAVSVRKKNPRGKHLPGLPAKKQRQYEHILESELAMGRSVKRAKSIAAGRVKKTAKKNPKTQGKGKTALKATGRALKKAASSVLGAGAQILGAGSTALNPHGMSEKAWKAEENKFRKSIAAYRAKNWTHQQIKDRLWLTYGLTLQSLSDDKAVFVDPFHRGGGFTLDLNPPKRGRRQNKTIIKAKRVVVLNKSAKRKRNAGHKDSDHPVEVTRHWRAGPPGYLTPWQRAHHAGQHDLFAHGIKPAKKRNSARFSASQWANEMARLRDIKPRPLVKMFGKSGGTPEQQTTWKAQMAEWNRQYRHASKMQKIALEEDNAAFRARQSQNKTKKKRAKRNASRSVHPSQKKTGRARAIGKTRNSSRRGSVAKTRTASASRVASKRNPSAESIRKEFAGKVTGERDVFVPASTPKGKLAKLGNLVLIVTEQGTIKPVRGSAVLLADTRGKLHIGTTSKANLFNGPRQSFGQVKRIEYDSTKPHLGYPSPIIWHHRMGEETGHRPTLHADGQGGLVFRGGRYRLTRRGIEN
jgi:hypothetical protein